MNDSLKLFSIFSLVLSGRKVFCGLLLAGMSLIPIFANAADVIEGKMNGLHCAQEGIVCPIEDLDAVIALESDFVVTTPDGKFYLIPNVDRAVKDRYILQDVRVKGTLHPRYQSIVADEFQVKNDDGSYRTAWSPELQERVYGDLKLPGSTRP
jgi:hypothetical protein